MTDPALSTIIPTLGETEALGDVLDGLERQQPPQTAAEVLVCLDNSAPDDRLGKLADAERTVPLRVIRPERAGASAARNAGWRAAAAPLVLFLDDDIVPTPRLIAEHLDWHARNPDPATGVLGLVRWSPSVKVTPFMRWLEMGIQFDYRRINGTDAGWEHFYSCNVSVKRQILEEVGGFDEQRFPFGYEDLDLGVRLSQVGFRLQFNRRAVGEHLKTETLETWRRKLARIAVSERRFIERYPDATPYFYERFRAVSRAPTARGRGASLARYVPRGLPWLGHHVWASYDMVCTQALAADFLSAWEAAGTAESRSG